LVLPRTESHSAHPLHQLVEERLLPLRNGGQNGRALGKMSISGKYGHVRQPTDSIWAENSGELRELFVALLGGSDIYKRDIHEKIIPDGLAVIVT